jgi:hypothetical protein
MFFLPVKIRSNSYITYFVENDIIADKLHCDSEHDDHFDSYEDNGYNTEYHQWPEGDRLTTTENGLL